jgi:hypothetical protein
MKFRVQMSWVSEAGAEERREVMEIDRDKLAMATLGLNLAEGKALLHGVQEFVVAQQVADDLERRRSCPDCGKRHTSKGQGSIEVKTVFGQVELPNPRWHRCACQSTGLNTFRPTTSWLNAQTSPELLYLETKWASLIPYAKVVQLLKDVLPIADTFNQETVRNHLHRTAERIEQGLGEEAVCLFEGSDPDWEEQPLPDGPMTVGIDGGFVRAAHKAGCFEVIAGKSVVAFRREDNDETPSAKCFGLVQTYDEKPRRRLWELLKSQGMQENQQVIFLSDGGESVRRLQEYLHPSSEHLIDWFHLTMRITVLQQQVKTLKDEQPKLGEEVARELESTKHFLWHGNTFQALQRLEGLLIDLEFPQVPLPLTQKVAKGISELETYIRNNEEFIPNFGERYRQGETISTAFVESTINQVVSKRFVKKQQMQWTPRGAHLLLQTRTKVLNDDLEEVFRGWYPQFHAQAA